MLGTQEWQKLIGGNACVFRFVLKWNSLSQIIDAWKMDKCAFCGEEGILQDSHILPAFVFRWLKKTSGTGHIRNSNAPNRRVQDGLKIPLLCAKCEGLFNGFETPFASQVFHPYDRNETQAIRYEQWMAKFCTSVSWRVLTYYKMNTDLAHFTDRQGAQVDGALSNWKGFLSGRISQIGKFEQHLLPLSAVVDTSISKLPNNINRYLLRAIDLDLPASKSIAFTYAKMGKFVVVGMISPPRDKWIGTRVFMKHGTFRPRKYVLPHSMLDYFIHRSNVVRDALDRISDKQKDVIDEEVIKNLDRFRGSGQLEAMLHDEQLFGTEAILRKE